MMRRFCRGAQRVSVEGASAPAAAAVLLCAVRGTVRVPKDTPVPTPVPPSPKSYWGPPKYPVQSDDEAFGNWANQQMARRQHYSKARMTAQPSFAGALGGIGSDEPPAGGKYAPGQTSQDDGGGDPFERPIQPGSGAAMEQQLDSEAGKNYARSTEVFKHKSVKLHKSYAGSEEARIITKWERLWYDWIRYFFTGETIAGKDRYGNLFTRKWRYLRGRNEQRICYRVDKDKRHQPYGGYPTDCRLWEGWQRGWRHDPPTPEEEEYSREKRRNFMGPHNVGDEEFEDTVVRSLAQTTHASVALKELDNEETYHKFLNHYDRRTRENEPQKEINATWTVGFARGDIFYNEEEVETMRTSMQNVFRDREWQMLEMKRQRRHWKQPYTVNCPDDKTDPNAYQGDPPHHYWERTDAGVPVTDGVEQLTTPELEKLKAECDQLEEERVNMRKELGLTDLGDWREGRAPIDKGYDPYQPPPVSDRWKPKCWSETWGVGGGHFF